jgi:Zn-dependent protease with chaperone function
VGIETEAAKLLVSDQEENQIGLQVKHELEQEEHVRYLTDPEVSTYVQGIAARILAFARKDRPQVKWQVSVIDDPKTVNAFATPGGFLYVYSGLLLDADDEAEVAGVLAHESGHVVARHAARQMVDAFGLQAVTSLALGQNPSLAAQVAASLASKGALLAHSRGEEQEADEYGARYASAAGYDPHGLVDFFRKLQAQEGKTPALLQWLSDHPATPDRIAAVNRYIAENHLGGSERDPEAQTRIKQHLQQLGQKSSRVRDVSWQRSVGLSPEPGHEPSPAIRARDQRDRKAHSGVRVRAERRGPGGLHPGRQVVHVDADVPEHAQLVLAQPADADAAIRALDEHAGQRGDTQIVEVLNQAEVEQDVPFRALQLVSQLEGIVSIEVAREAHDDAAGLSISFENAVPHGSLRGRSARDSRRRACRSRRRAASRAGLSTDPVGGSRGDRTDTSHTTGRSWRDGRGRSRTMAPTAG